MVLTNGRTLRIHWTDKWELILNKRLLILFSAKLAIQIRHFETEGCNPKEAV